MTKGTSLYEDCIYAKDDSELLLRCISNRFQQSDMKFQNEQSSTIDWLLIFCGALVFFMQAGFAMICAGSVRKKNMQNTMLKNILDCCGAAIAFYSIGYAFAFGGQNDNDNKTFIGTTNFFLIGTDDFAFWFFQVCFVASCNTIVAGTIAERCQMGAYCYYSIFVSGFVYPVVAHAIWSNNGIFSAFANDPFNDVGVIDFAGSGVVHLTGGTISLAATWILGARRGRFHDEEGNLLKEPKLLKGHSIALQLLGTFILWFGWYGFNAGSALLLPNAESAGAVAGRVVANTTMAASAGSLSALFTNMVLRKIETNDLSFDLGKAMNGSLAGLVAITAACGTVELWAATLTGVVAGWFYLLGSHLLVKFHLDDVVDGIPVHMANGIWGMIATGLFTSPRAMREAFGTADHFGLMYHFGRAEFDGTLLGNQLLAVFSIISWSIFTMVPFFTWLNHVGLFRSSGLEEVVGLDIRYHEATTEEVEQAMQAVQQSSFRKPNNNNNNKRNNTKRAISSRTMASEATAAPSNIEAVV